MLDFIDLESTYFGLWIQFSLVAVVPIILIALGLYLGVESVTSDQASDTLDIVFSLPISKVKYFLIRILGSILYICIAIIVGIIFTFLATYIAGFELTSSFLNTLYQVWFIILLQTLLGLFVGSFLGAIYFNRAFGFF